MIQKAINVSFSYQFDYFSTWFYGLNIIHVHGSEIIKSLILNESVEWVK